MLKAGSGQKGCIIYISLNDLDVNQVIGTLYTERSMNRSQACSLFEIS